MTHRPCLTTPLKWDQSASWTLATRLGNIWCLQRSEITVGTLKGWEMNLIHELLHWAALLAVGVWHFLTTGIGWKTSPPGSQWQKMHNTPKCQGSHPSKKKKKKKNCCFFSVWHQMIGCCFYSLVNNATSFTSSMNTYTWYSCMGEEGTCPRFNRLKAILNHRSRHI